MLETPNQSSDPQTATLPTGASRFVRACLGLPVDRTPVWFLRQAGRYMPEYMAVRKHHSLLDICRTPDIAAEVTITAAEHPDVDVVNFTGSQRVGRIIGSLAAGFVLIPGMGVWKTLLNATLVSGVLALAALALAAATAGALRKGIASRPWTRPYMRSLAVGGTRAGSPSTSVRI